MKKVLIGVMAFFLMCGVVQAAPFLVCGPQQGVLLYEVELDGIVISSDIAAESDGSIHYDVEGFVSPGNHTFKARCKNIWRWSDYSDPFDFNADAPGAPSGFGFSAE